ncbi:hypothetical protein GF312_16585, partial [Candidatus Poribacteria bacterium]|nr:hypothetical protein [Candidatus Poribacteria bacterium]
MKPEIKTEDIKLVGLQAVVNFSSGDVGVILSGLTQKLFQKINDIPNKSDSKRFFGYWQFVDNNTRVYFAGVEVDSFDGFKWDYEYGLGSWSLGDLAFAVFQRQGLESTAPLYSQI